MTAAQKTKEIQQIEELLRPVFPQVEAYRYNSVSIRIRIVDDRFRNKSDSARAKIVDPLLEKLPEGTQNDITILLLLAPEETGLSMMNLEFDNPTPSRL